MTVNIKAAFSKDEREFNGLEAIRAELVKDPHNRRVIVGVVETSKITVDIEDGGTETPTIRFVQVEVLDGDDASQARGMMDAAFRTRTGRSDSAQPSLLDGNDPAAS